MLKDFLPESTAAASDRASARQSTAARLAEQATRWCDRLLDVANRQGPAAARFARLHRSLAMLQGRAIDDVHASARQIAQAVAYGSYCLATGNAAAVNHPLLIDLRTEMAALGHPLISGGEADRALAAPRADLYEEFLVHFNRREKEARGVFYTPPAVAAAVVEGIDRMLRRDTPIGDGLLGGGMSDTPSHARPPVVMLDPAAGTGRFLEAVVVRIHQSLTECWREEGSSAALQLRRWRHYVPRHLLPRLVGFEWSLAPYLAAHAELANVLRATGYELKSTDRIHVYLTDALAADIRAPDDIPLPGFAEEARRVARFKTESPFIVIVGNPPYANFSANMSPAARELVARYKQIDGRPLDERNRLQLERNVNDDYIKFLARAEDLLAARATAALGFVVNRSLLESATLRGVRARLLEIFQHVHVVDLGGDGLHTPSARGASADENVFDTSQGVALLLAARSNRPRRRTTVLNYVRVRGSRDAKLAAIDPRRDSPPRLETGPVGPPDFRFRLTPGSEFWRQCTPIDALLSVYAEGLKTGCDRGLIGFTPEDLREKLDDWRHVAERVELMRSRYAVSTRGWAHRLLSRPAETSLAAAESTRIVRFAYRPLDFRYCAWPSGLLKAPSTVAGRHLAEQDNLCLIVARQVAGPADVSHFFVSRAVPDNRLLYSRRGSATYFPLYGATDESQSARRSFLCSEAMKRWAEKLAWQWIDHGTGDLRKTLGPESILHFAYALFHAATYRAQFDHELRVGFPRVAMTQDRELLIQLCTLGADLVACHLVEPDYPAASWNRESSTATNPLTIDSVEFAGAGDMVVGRGYPKHAGGRIRLNRQRCLGSITEDVWRFRIGGYQMAHKWLKDRRGRRLTAPEIEDYLSLLAVQKATIHLMDRVDAVVQGFRVFEDDTTSRLNSVPR